jgi:hypothetical protein
MLNFWIFSVIVVLGMGLGALVLFVLQELKKERCSCGPSKESSFVKTSDLPLIPPPLPATHWIFRAGAEPFSAFRGVTKIVLIKEDGSSHEVDIEDLRINLEAAARYAVKTATIYGTEMDIDPDLFVQNFLNIVFGKDSVLGKK